MPSRSTAIRRYPRGSSPTDPSRARRLRRQSPVSNGAAASIARRFGARPLGALAYRPSGARFTTASHRREANFFEVQPESGVGAAEGAEVIRGLAGGCVRHERQAGAGVGGRAVVFSITMYLFSESCETTTLSGRAQVFQVFRRACRSGGILGLRHCDDGPRHHVAAPRRSPMASAMAWVYWCCPMFVNTEVVGEEDELREQVRSAAAEGAFVSSAESAAIAAVGGRSAATYGEITRDGFAALAHDPRISLCADDVFADLGSGLGRPCSKRRVTLACARRSASRWPRLGTRWRRRSSRASAMPMSPPAASSCKATAPMLHCGRRRPEPTRRSPKRASSTLPRCSSRPS